jgi:hypothetical protein
MTITEAIGSTTVTAVTVTDSAAGIALRKTSPEYVTFHLIEDYELEMITNISRPISLSLAGAALGGILGLSPNVVAAFGAASKATASSGDLITLCIWGGCVVGFVITGFLAAKGESQAAATKQNIRARPTSSM